MKYLNNKQKLIVKEQYLFLKENFTSESEVKSIEDFVDEMLKESMEERERNMEEIRLCPHIAPVVSPSCTVLNILIIEKYVLFLWSEIGIKVLYYFYV